MSSCPKCGKKLRVFDWKQHCPFCGVNLRFYGFSERFTRDAKMAELSLARAHIKLRVMKSAFIGGKLAKARLALMLLPLLSMLLPAAKAQVTLPFLREAWSLSGPGLYGMVSGGALRLIASMAASAAAGEAFAALKNLIIAFAAMAIPALLVFLLTLFSFAGIKKMAAVLCAVACLGAVSCAASAVLVFIFQKAAQSSPNGILAGAPSFGLLAAFAAFAAAAAVNYFIARKGLPVAFEEGDLERAEIAQKVKRGEISIDDLPQPIVETAETRAIEEEIRKVRQQFEQREEPVS